MRVFRHLNDLPEFQRAVVTIGSFDGVHRGHQEILARVRDLAARYDGESVVVTFSPHPRRVLQPNFTELQLLTTTEEKIELLARYGIQNVVVVPFTLEWSRQSPQQYLNNFLLKFQPAAVVIGYDHRFGRARAGTVELLREHARQHDYEVIQIERQEVDAITVSSTETRRAVSRGEVARAHELMGHCFQLSGPVVEGQRIGTEIGFPTANVQITDPDKLIPPDGIYAVQAIVRKRLYDGMLYIGGRPSIPGAKGRTIEVNLFDFNEDIYGEHIELELLRFVRGDAKFDSLPELTEQLHRDREAVQAILKKKRTAEKELSFSSDQQGFPAREARFDTNKPTSSTEVATVILNWNGRQYLQKFLPPLQKTTYQNHRIVVADNASTDDSVELLDTDFPEVELIRLDRNHGFAGGYNLALQSIESPYVCLLNSDVRVTPGWLEPLVKILDEQEDVAAVQPKILSEQMPTHFEYAGAAGGFLDKWGYPFCRGRILDELEADHGQYDTPTDIFWASGAALLIRTDLFRRLGGFDADYFAHWEEIDLCWRLRRAGYRIVCEPASTVYHVGGGTLAYQSPRKVYLNFRNALLTLRKNEPRSRRWWLLPWRMVLDGVAALVYVLRGQPELVGSILRAHGSVYGNWGAVNRRRKRYNELIERHGRGDAVRSGRRRGSVLWAFYARGRRRFAQIID